MLQSKVLLAEPTRKIVLLTMPRITEAEVVYFEKVERYKLIHSLIHSLKNKIKSIVCTY